jgi:two-component system chemotaxis response regulator CheB
MINGKLVVIGCSAGGIQQLRNLFSLLPHELNLSIVIVQHINKDQEAQRIADVLKEHTSMSIRIPYDKERIQAETIYLAPSNYHLMITSKKRFELSTDDEVNFSRPSIDVLFETAAEAFHINLISVVLSGANHDGAAGTVKVKQMGGTTIAQNPQEATYKYMPQKCIETNAVDHIFNIQDMAKFLAKSGLNFDYKNSISD